MQVYIEKENPMSKAAETYCYDGSGKFSLKNYPTNSKKDGPVKEEIVAKFDKTWRKWRSSMISSTPTGVKV